MRARSKFAVIDQTAVSCGLRASEVRGREITPRSRALPAIGETHSLCSTLLFGAIPSLIRRGDARSWIPALPADFTFSGSLSFAGAWDDGSIAIVAQPVRRGMSPPQVTRRSAQLLKYSPTGEVLASLGAFPGTEYYEGLGNPGSIRPLPFARSVQFAPAVHHTFVGSSDSYEIRRFRGDGQLEQLIRR